MSDPRTDPRGSPDALQRALAELNISSDDKRASAEKKIGDAVHCFWWFENGASCAPTQREMKERAARVHAALGVILENVTPENLYLSVALFRNSHRYRRERRDDFLKRLKQLREELDVLSVAAGNLAQSSSERGRKNLWTKIYAPAKAALAHECAYISDFYRPEILSGYTGGPFARFVGAVYEFATGQEPTADGVGLEKYVKHYGRVFARQRSIQREFEAGRLNFDEFDAEMDTLEAQLEAYGSM